MHLDYVGEGRGNLHIIRVCRLITTLFKVFELKQDSSGWVLRYHRDFGPLEAAVERSGLFSVFYCDSA